MSPGEERFILQLHGDRASGDDPHLIGGFRWFEDQRAVYARYEAERVSPTAARTVLRWLRLAEQLTIPIVLEDLPLFQTPWENPFPVHQLIAALLETSVPIVAVVERSDDLVSLADGVVLAKRVNEPSVPREVVLERWGAPEEKKMRIAAALRCLRQRAPALPQERLARVEVEASDVVGSPDGEGQ